MLNEKAARFAIDFGLGEDRIIQERKRTRIRHRRGVFLLLTVLLLAGGGAWLVCGRGGHTTAFLRALATRLHTSAPTPGNADRSPLPMPPAPALRTEATAPGQEKTRPARPAPPATDTGGQAAPTPAASVPPLPALTGVDALIRARRLEEAAKRLQALVQARETPDTGVAGAYYRLGVVSRLRKNEEDALGYWDRAFRAFPQTRGGRLAALALADTVFARACGTAPDYKRWEEASRFYTAALGRDEAPFLPPDTRTRVIANLRKLSRKLFFGNAPLAGAVYYTVRPGDMLYSIARKYKLHYGSIASINHLRPPRYTIRKGQRLKILPEARFPCRIVVNKRTLTLTLYLGGMWVRRYPCCVGSGDKTPAGTYTISRKEANPAWRDPASGKLYDYGHPKNVLGTRWLALEGNGTEGLGIHGTTQPESVPGRTSNGCVRLRNAAVEELYGFALIHSKVTILDQ